MAVLCAAFPIAAVAAALSSSPGLVLIVTYGIASALGALHMVRAQPLPMSQRWRQSVLTFAPVALLFLLVEAVRCWK
jgi:hypothetical protein